MSASKAKVLLVDDHLIFRYGMAMLISLEPDMEVFAEAGNGGEALAVLKVEHHPDIVLMDVSLKTHSGFGIIRGMHSRISALPMIVVSLQTKRFLPNELCRRVRVLRDEAGAGQGSSSPLELPTFHI